MTPFFRRIRHKLANENKFLKYSRYAIGEIVLVVIGILIALQINTWNEQHKSEARIQLLFEKILIEIGSNIVQTQRLIDYSKHIDTLGYLVSAKKLNYQDYANPKTDDDGNLIVKQLYFPQSQDLSSLNDDICLLNTSAYDNLISNIDEISSKYENIVNELNSMYKIDKKSIDIANDDAHQYLKEIKAQRRLKYDWVSLHPFSPEQNNGMINYMLNNYEYKNEIRGFWELNKDRLNKTLSYRNRAVRTYQELATLLNKSTVHDSFKVDPEVVNLISGTYRLTDTKYGIEEEYIESFKFEENLIIMTMARNPNIAWEHTLLDFNITQNRSRISMLRNSGSLYMNYYIEGDSLTAMNNGGNYWKFVKVN